jgi:hypothetical protein
MPNERIWKTYRDGNWSVSSDQPTSPWYDGGQGDNQTGLATIPRGGYGGTDFDSATAGDTAWILHRIIINADVEIGGSLPEAGWHPVSFSATGGSAVTFLPSGVYRAAYAAVPIIGNINNPGATHIGLTESVAVPIVQSVSRPRATFPSAPPVGCTWTLVLTPTDGPQWSEVIYCPLITGSFVDLVGGQWNNTYAGGIASGGTSPATGSGRALAMQIPTQVIGGASGISVTDGGVLTMTGAKLTCRGDILIVTPVGGIADKLIFQGGGISFDGSLSPDPSRGHYVIWCSGGCKIFLNG